MVHDLKSVYDCGICSSDQVLGKGGFGTVKIGSWKGIVFLLHRSDLLIYLKCKGERVAHKILVGNKAKMSFENEKLSLSLGSHPCLVGTLAVLTKDVDGNHAKIFTSEGV